MSGMIQQDSVNVIKISRSLRCNCSVIFQNVKSNLTVCLRVYTVPLTDTLNLCYLRVRTAAAYRQ